MSFIYVLILQDNKYYVGQTNNSTMRIEQHCEGNGSVWTKKYKPIDVMSIKASNGPFDENNTTKMLMIKYGIDNVRGGSYCTEFLDKNQKDLLQKELWGVDNCCIRCGYKDHFINMCNKRVDINGNKIILKSQVKKDKVKKNINKSKNSIKICKLCGRNTHYTKNCYAITNINGNPIEKKPCTRCKNIGHKKNKCYAKIDINGNIL
jgi:hypothetical protein